MQWLSSLEKVASQYIGKRKRHVYNDEKDMGRQRRKRHICSCMGRQKMQNDHKQRWDITSGRSSRACSPTQRYFKSINRPMFIEMFFKYFSCIDIGDHLSQGSLIFHTVWRTTTWWRRLFSTFDAEIIVNDYYHYKYDWIFHNGGNDIPGRLDFMDFVDELSFDMMNNTIGLGSDGVAMAAAARARRQAQRMNDQLPVINKCVEFI